MDPATQSTLLIIGAIGTQIGILIAAVFAGLAARDAKRIATETKAETLAQTTKIDAVAKDAAVVLGHVNSEKSAAEGRENTMKRENDLLREMLADRKQTAALLAQAATVLPSGGTAPVLERIETNTAATADGVQKLKP